MEIATIILCITALAVAEPPPSHSYLPPPATTRNEGYSKGPQIPSLGAPEVVAARAFDGRNPNGLNHGTNAFARNGGQNHPTPRLGTEVQGYEQNVASFARNALEEVNAEPANYNFGYMVNDYHEGTDFGHHEERQEEYAQGQYHVVLPDGRKQTVNYEADERGFKPQISYQDTEDLTRAGGYDSNANSRTNGGSVHSNGFGQNGDGVLSNGFGQNGGHY